MKKVPTTKTKSQTPKQIKTFYKLESTFPSFITSLRHDYTKNLTQQKKKRMFKQLLHATNTSCKLSFYVSTKREN